MIKTATFPANMIVLYWQIFSSIMKTRSTFSIKVSGSFHFYFFRIQSHQIPYIFCQKCIATNCELCAIYLFSFLQPYSSQWTQQVFHTGMPSLCVMYFSTPYMYHFVQPECILAFIELVFPRKKNFEVWLRRNIKLYFLNTTHVKKLFHSCVVSMKWWPNNQFKCCAFFAHKYPHLSCRRWSIINCPYLVAHSFKGNRDNGLTGWQ